MALTEEVLELLQHEEMFQLYAEQYENLGASIGPRATGRRLRTTRGGRSRCSRSRATSR